MKLCSAVNYCACDMLVDTFRSANALRLHAAYLVEVKPLQVSPTLDNA